MTRLRLALLGLATVCLVTPAARATTNPPDAELLGKHLTRLEEVVTRYGDDSIHNLPNETSGLLSHLQLLEPKIDALDEDQAGELRPRLEALRLKLQELTMEAPSEVEVETRKTPKPTARPLPIAAKAEGPAPINDACGSAIAIGNGTFAGDTTNATQDGRSSCSPGSPIHDVWYRYTAPADGLLTTILEGATFGVVSIHAACPGTRLTELSCNRPTEVVAGQDVLIRVADTFESSFTLHVGPPGTLSGTVTDAVSGEGLSSYVVVTDSDDFEVGFAEVTGGAYVVPLNVVPGTSETVSETVYIQTRNTPDYLDEHYDNVICDKFCFPAPAGRTPIEVASGQAVSGIDFELDRLGTISGTVTDAVTGQPIPSAYVSARDENGNGNGNNASADSSGQYTIRGLRPGDYVVTARDDGYLAEMFEDIPCPNPFGNCDPTGTTPIPVALNADASGVDFALRTLGGITGTVTHAATGEPIPMISVQLFRADGSFVGSVMTDAAGEYTLGGAQPGIHYAKTQGYSGYINELYNGIQCPITASCEPTTGAPITVAVSTFTQGIDFTLDRGGRIEGRVVDDAGLAIPFPSVSIHTEDGSRVINASSESDGSYSADSLPTGTYRVTAAASQYLTELYDDLACPDFASSCDFAAGAPVATALETVTSGIDFDLDRLGALSGTFTDEATGEPIRDAVAEIFDESGRREESQQPRSEGFYEASGLAPGTYYVTGEDSSYESELYDSLPCPDGAPEGCDPTTGTPVVVSLNTVTPNVDFSMIRRPMGSIAGIVRDEATGEPILSISLDAWNEDGSNVAGGSTGGLGNYQILGLSPGTYFVTARDFDDYISELHANIPCPDLTCDPTTGTPVIVTDDGTVTVDFALTRRGMITGSVRDSLFGDPISSVTVSVWDDAGNFIDSDRTNNTGIFEIQGLDPGRYFVKTSNSEGFLNELYPNLPCPVGACDPTAGTSIEVDLNTIVSGIDFELDLQQGISGRVTRGFNGLPFASASLDVWDSQGNRVDRFSAGASGGFSLGLPLGTYFISSNSGGYPGVIHDVLYDGIACPSSSGCDEPTTGTPIRVTTNTVTQGIDLEIPTVQPTCTPSATRLCLLDGRFLVKVNWEDFDGNLGSGQAEQLTDATGTFWFFTPDNIEIVVKVLDACGFFDHFWVFAASLTNAGVELYILDLFTGEERTYTNPLGNPAEPIQDTGAFATCSVPGPGLASPARESSAPGNVLAVETRQELEGVLNQLQTEAPRRPLSDSAPANIAAPQGTCTPSATRLCVEDGRFQVETFWRTTEGEEGMGQAEQLSAATGYFWFFSPENVEAVVKVLNACNLPSFENYWVFAAGLTDVEVLVRVTDTVTGQAREYSNPQGTPFRPIQDTGAFDACP